MACLCLALPLLVACSSPQARPVDPNTVGAASISIQVDVQSVGASVYAPESGRTPDAGLEASCNAWKLDPAGVARSREYPDGLQDAFYALPCTISGQLQYHQGHAWEYQINAASTATWTRGDVVRTFGCSDQACTSLVLMMPDGNAGH
jgi:hypothetical protein